MSGSGGGGPYGGSSSDAGGCDIVEQVPLNSVQGAVLPGLTVQDQLAVEVRDGALVAVTQANEVAGSLTPSSLARLLRCIEQGREYVAIILRIEGALVELEIRPK